MQTLDEKHFYKQNKCKYCNTIVSYEIKKKAYKNHMGLDAIKLIICCDCKFLSRSLAAKKAAETLKSNSEKYAE